MRISNIKIKPFEISCYFFLHRFLHNEDISHFITKIILQTSRMTNWWQISRSLEHDKGRFSYDNEPKFCGKNFVIILWPKHSFRYFCKWMDACVSVLHMCVCHPSWTMHVFLYIHVHVSALGWCPSSWMMHAYLYKQYFDRKYKHY